MSSSTSDHLSDYINSQPRGFLTPPPSWSSRFHSPVMPPYTERNTRRSPTQYRRGGGDRGDFYHIIHKVPSGDSPYVRAKHTQLIDKDPNKAISQFWASINAGDRVDSALKDMAIVMKQLDRSDEAVEAIKSFRHLCSNESQESLDNILIELYKQSGRTEEEIEILRLKLKKVEEGIAFGGKSTKTARSQGRKIQITVGKEYSRLLGNLAWAYMQKKDFKSAEEHYRKSLSFESDKNRQCNLALCLMHMNKLQEARFLLQTINLSSDNNGNVDESCARSYDRAVQMLAELDPENDLKHMNLYRINLGRDEACSMRKRDHRSPSCYNTPLVPFTQPRRFSRAFREGDTRNAYDVSCKNLCFEPQATTSCNKEVKSLANGNANSHSNKDKENLSCNNMRAQKKSWAEMVEEDEQNSEEAIESLNQDSEKSSGKATIKVRSEYLSQPEKNDTLSVTSNCARRSLCFSRDDQKLSDNRRLSPANPMKTRNGLKVFDDITN